MLESNQKFTAAKWMFIQDPPLKKKKEKKPHPAESL